MKKIGLLGGMSWESSLEYYKIINEEIKNNLGGLHSGRVLLNSLDFEPIEKLQHEGNWQEMGEILTKEALCLQRGGADFVLICTNTMHKLFGIVEKSLKIPMLHIADATAEVLKKEGIKKVGLLGTAFTMEQDFYKGRLKEKFGFEVLIPKKAHRDLVHKVIYEELCLGITKESSKKHFVEIVEDLAKEGAQGVILGCTEIGLLISQEDTDVKLFDTTLIHAKEAVRYAIEDNL